MQDSNHHLKAFMIRIVKVMVFFFYVSFLSAQETNSVSNSADICISNQIETEVKKSTIDNNPLIIVNGYLVTTKTEFEILEKVSCSEINSINFLSKEKASEQFDGEKARNGIVLVSLKKKGGRIWKRNYRLLN